jgi:hypothetical protein
MRHLQFSSWTSSEATLKWVLNETGVSTIDMTSWMFLDVAKLVVDGSAYTGGSTNINLIDGVTINGLAAASNITVSGFSESYTAQVVQDTAAGDVRLEITELAPQDPIGDIHVGGAGGNMVLSWDTTLGQTYNVETNENLMTPNWGIYAVIIGDGGTVSVTNTPDYEKLYYMVTTP